MFLPLAMLKLISFGQQKNNVFFIWFFSRLFVSLQKNTTAIYVSGKCFQQRILTLFKNYHCSERVLSLE